MSNFIIDLLRYNKNHYFTDFLNQIYSSSLIPHITSPEHLTSQLKALIDNVFSTDTENEIFAGYGYIWIQCFYYCSFLGHFLAYK